MPPNGVEYDHPKLIVYSKIGVIFEVNLPCPPHLYAWDLHLQVYVGEITGLIVSQ